MRISQTTLWMLCSLAAGVQTFGYAVFFMNETKLKYLDDIYVFFFDQTGLMAGLGLRHAGESPLQAAGQVHRQAGEDDSSCRS